MGQVSAIPWCIHFIKRTNVDADKLIQLHLGDPTNFSIFPQLANILSLYQWNALADVGITPSNYTTQGILKENPFENSFSLKELLIVDIPKKLVRPDDAFYSYTDVKEISQDSIQCLTEALDILNRVEGLYPTINILVKNLHILRSQSDEVDVSYSLPNIPFSIFVSVPIERLANDHLRVAEAILHETMHLQLSLIEKIKILVKNKSDDYYSPWKGEYRSIQGILHAVYVFRIIQHFYQILSSLKVNHKYYDFYIKRIQQIEVEIELFKNINQLSSLTPSGNQLIQILIKSS